MTLALKVGQILYASWGFDQTNIDYFEVVKATPKTVTIREIEADSTPSDHNFMVGTSKPKPGVFKNDGMLRGEAARRTVQTGYDGEPMLRITKYAFAHPTEAETVHNWTAYA